MLSKFKSIGTFCYDYGDNFVSTTHNFWVACYSDVCLQHCYQFFLHVGLWEALAAIATWLRSNQCSALVMPCHCHVQPALTVFNCVLNTVINFVSEISGAGRKLWQGPIGSSMSRIGKSCSRIRLRVAGNRHSRYVCCLRGSNAEPCRITSCGWAHLTHRTPRRCSGSKQLVNSSQLPLASMLSQETQSKLFFVLQILGSWGKR